MNINSLTSSFKNFIVKQNTTTADYPLSTNLKKNVKKIYKGVKGSHDSLPIRQDALPAVFIQADTTAFEFYQLGKNSRRKAEVTFSIVGVTHYGMGVGDEGEGRQSADMEALQLAENIERIIHDNVRLSNTVQYIKVDNSNYNSNVADNAYNSIVEINVKGEVYQ